MQVEESDLLVPRPDGYKRCEVVHRERRDDRLAAALHLEGVVRLPLGGGAASVPSIERVDAPVS